MNRRLRARPPKHRFAQRSGKTILPIRKHKELLEDPQAMDRLLRLEHDLARDPFAAARASHLQITVKRPVV